MDFLFVLIEYFSLVTVKALRPHTQKTLVADFLQAKYNFRRKTAVLHFEPLLEAKGRRTFILGSLKNAQWASYQC